ncbi:hypothetical protein V1264_001850 [Littorina saxatilis]
MALKDATVCREIPEVMSLALYYKSTWLSGEYPPAMWNVHDTDIRTNNRVESWHSKLNKIVGRQHPNVHVLVNILREEQAQMEISLNRARLGARPPSRRRKYRELDERLMRLREMFRQGDMTTDEFLTSVRHIVHHH